MSRSIDERLADPAQVAMREVVRAMPEESLSMAWRSGLNERLIAEASRRQRRVRFLNIFRPVAGLALAGALAAVFFVRTSNVPSVTPGDGADRSLEAELISVHTQTVGFADVAGGGLRPLESTYVSRSTAQPVEFPEWSEVDVDAL